MKALTEQQLQAIVESVLNEDRDSMDDFYDALRLFSHSGGIRKYSAAEIQKLNDLFDENLERLYVQNNRVWRGMSLNDWNDLDPDFDFRHKEIVYDQHWMSTSRRRHTAETYMRDPAVISTPRNPQVFILFEIMINDETKGFDVASHGEAEFSEYANSAPDDLDWNDEDAVVKYFDNMGSTTNEDDAEIILQRGSRFQVVEKEQKPCEWKPDAEYWEVKLEWIGAD